MVILPLLQKQRQIWFNKPYTSFNSGEDLWGNGVHLSNDTIGFTTFHKFRDAERVIYDNGGQTNVGGMDTDSSYYVSVVDNLKSNFIIENQMLNRI